ncbi:MFS transporter [Lichenicola sp.]|uniref:MFS transporter n=1 Tax=Lichenicola sp. TaxID=2804529 RepID=UPI003B00EDD4
MIATPETPARPGERLATTGIFLVNGLGIGAWASCIPWLRAEFGLSTGLLTLVLLGFAAGAVLAMPLAGLLAPRLGTGRATTLSAAGFALSLPLPALAGGGGWLIAAAVMLGATNGALDVSMNAEASRIEQRQGRAIMSSFHAAFSGGGLAGAALGAGLVALHAGGLAVLWAASVLALIAAGIGRRVLGIGQVASGGAGLRLPAGSVLPLCACALLCMLCEGAMTDWSAVYLATVAGARPAAAVAGFAAFSGAMLLGRLTGDGVVRALSRTRVVRLGAALAAAGLALAAVVPEVVPATIGFGLVGLGLSNVVPAIFSAAGERGASPAAGIAMAATAGYAGFLIGPPVVGTIATGFGLRASMLLLALAALAILVLAGMFRDRRAAAQSFSEP